MPGARAIILALFLAATCGAQAQTACRTALAIGLDVSSSVDPDEHAAQLLGLGAALTAPAVQNLILNGGDPVALAVFEWSGRLHQAELVPWTIIHSGADLSAIALQLAGAPRGAANLPTAIGSAMQYGAAVLQAAPDCRTQVLDLSADGPQNDGPRPRDVRRAGLPASLVINALVIAGADRDTLVPYFQAEVITGPGAFVELATDYADYARAMERKLLRELTLAVSWLQVQ